MDGIIEFFDEIKKRYVAVPVYHVDALDVNDRELKNIEKALIRFADLTCHKTPMLSNG